MTTRPPSALAPAIPPFPAEAVSPFPLPPRPYRLWIKFFSPPPLPPPPLPPSLPETAARFPLPPEASPIAVPPPASMSIFVLLSTSPPSMETGPAEHSPWPPPMPPTLIVLPRLPPELILPMTTMPPSALAFARPPFPAEAIRPARPPRPPRPYRLWISPRSPPRRLLPPSSSPEAAARLSSPPEASAMAVPPLASISMLVLLLTVPPSMENCPPTAADVADADRIPLVAAGVDLVDDDDAAVGAGASDSAVSGQDGVVTVGQTHVAVAARGIADRRTAARVDSR